jgi:nucleotide-binding universal stress UspA family protein
MSKRILVATDFSELGRAAVTAALELAQASDAKIDVLHVYTALGAPEVEGYAGVPLPQLEAHARTELARAADEVAAAGRLGESLLHFGEAAPRILLTAEERASDFIVLGSHGRRGLSRLVLGSTAEDVLRRAHVPVWVVKQAPRAPTRTIGVAVDLGPESGHVVATAFELAQSLERARVHLLHAYPPVVVPNEYGAGSVQYEALHQQAQESLRDLASPYERLPTMGKCVVELGDPTTVILEQADELALDLLVLGTHGRQGLTRWVVGSVAESVLRQAHLPVLVVTRRRPPDLGRGAAQNE